MTVNMLWLKLLSDILTICRSNYSEVFYKKCVLLNFVKFTGKHLQSSPFLVKKQIKSFY